MLDLLWIVELSLTEDVVDLPVLESWQCWLFAPAVAVEEVLKLMGDQGEKRMGERMGQE